MISGTSICNEPNVVWVVMLGKPFMILVIAVTAVVNTVLKRNLKIYKISMSHLCAHFVEHHIVHKFFKKTAISEEALLRSKYHQIRKARLRFLRTSTSRPFTKWPRRG